MMKLTPLLFLLLGLPAVLSHAQESPNQNALESAGRDVRSSQAQVTQARRDYLADVQKSGAGSPNARASKTRLDATRTLWRSKMAARRKLRQQTRNEIMQRHNDHHPTR